MLKTIKTPLLALVVGAALVWFLFPRRDREREMYQQFGTN